MKPKKGQKKPARWGRIETINVDGRQWKVPLPKKETFASITGLYHEVAMKIVSWRANAPVLLVLPVL